MPMNRVFLKRLKNLGVDQSGAIAAYAAIGLTVFLGLGALTVDIGHMVSVKGELQKAADAGALAGARGLWPVNLSTATSREPNGSNAETIALTTAKNNRVDGLNLTDAEVIKEAGVWDYSTKSFTHGDNSDARGVRVTTQRADVQMFLAKILGQVPKDMSATAVAVMDFAAEVGKGSLPIAVNLPTTVKPGDEVKIIFGPDNTDNGGWFAVEVNANAATLKDYINNDSCPALKIGDTLTLNNGQVDAALKLLETELSAYPDGWVVLLPGVSTPKYNQTDKIDSFVPIKITKVQPGGGEKYIMGTLLTLAEAQSAQPGPGKPGGVPYSGLSTPKLVQ